MSTAPIRIEIADEMGLTRSVLEAASFAKRCGFGAADCQRISTATSELARNILKYASNGEIHLRWFNGPEECGVEVEARDQGPGIEDIEGALSDHFSTSGTLGLGLPGVKRLMDTLDLESRPGVGLRVIARKWQP